MIFQKKQNNAKSDRDMTAGNPFMLISSFAFSLVIGNLFQQLYTFVDTIIIGKKIGTLGLAAVGGTEWLVFLVNGFIIGLIQGFSVLLGNSFGEKNEEDFARYYTISKRLCILLSVVLTAVFFTISGFLLGLLGTKPEVMPYANTYIRTLFLGLPFLIFYQLFSAALRSRGNSHIPLIAMTVSSLCNIVLDILFVNLLGLGIAGAALGTILSEGIVMIICGYYFYRESKNHSMVSTPIKCNGLAAKLLRMGIPMAMQSVITSIGGLIVVNRINQFDITFLAGYTAATKLYGLLEIAASSFGLAVTSYVSQNYGANLIGRIRIGVRVSLLMGIAVSLVCSCVMLLGGNHILKLFIDNSDAAPDIITYGNRFLCILAAFFPFLYILYIMRSALQGINNAIVPMLSSFAQLVMRLFCALFLTKVIGSDGFFWGEISAWLLADCILFAAYFLQMHEITHTLS